jgi:hypothetical protein
VRCIIPYLSSVLTMMINFYVRKWCEFLYLCTVVKLELRIYLAKRKCHYGSLWSWCVTLLPSIIEIKRLLELLKWKPRSWTYVSTISLKILGSLYTVVREWHKILYITGSCTLNKT